MRAPRLVRAGAEPSAGELLRLRRGPAGPRRPRGLGAAPLAAPRACLRAGMRDPRRPPAGARRRPARAPARDPRSRRRASACSTATCRGGAAAGLRRPRVLHLEPAPHRELPAGAGGHRAHGAARATHGSGGCSRRSCPTPATSRPCSPSTPSASSGRKGPLARLLGRTLAAGRDRARHARSRRSTARCARSSRGSRPGLGDLRARGRRPPAPRSRRAPADEV